MFALRTKIGIKPMFEIELETFASDIGSQTIVVRRANTRFAPTLFRKRLLFGGRTQGSPLHWFRKLVGSRLLRPTRKFQLKY